jgi:7-cyano-7-deazaguanine synthase
MAVRSAILLSGGMDSTALAYWTRPVLAITVDYGQRCAQGEIDAASAVCHALGIQHDVIRVDCAALGSGDLSSRAALPLAPVPEWWPFRNQLLITLAAIRVIEHDITELMIGSVRTDNAHLDGRLEFFSAISAAMEVQEGALRVLAPALHLTASELIQASKVPMAVLAWAHSCHVANFACGRCRGCSKHYETTREIGLDPF